jgi:hypothetical protein
MRARYLVVAIVLLGLTLGLFVWLVLGAVASYGKEGPARITRWTAETELISDRCGKKCRRYSKLKRWTGSTSYKRSREPIAYGRGGCSTIRTVSHGGNAFDRSLVRFGMSSRWCYKRGKVRRYRLNTWGETDGWAMWNYQGVTNVVEHCSKLPCSRVYRRAYARFTRGIGQFNQSAETWIAHSMRAGRYSVDKK